MQGRVRLVLFDVFDTLCTPRLPVHEQYAAEARKFGLHVSPERVRAGFRPAFKEMNATHPLYGKHSTPPLTPESWWTGLIVKCMAHAGASETELARIGDKLGESIMRRFESLEGYCDFPETLDVLRGLRALGVPTSVVSNSDPRIFLTLDALEIEPLITCGPTLSWDVEAAKPDRRIYEAACKACGVDPGPGVIMVGDELEADYRGSLAAGLEGRLVRRDGEWSDGAVRHGVEDLDGVHVISSLSDVLREVKRRNA
ncbi:HAD-like protein [Cutaneotrichosporon oleaginosum]|uniref:HAD-like protein n=1 Tax=Cutaneotrichosporon oleaginosum TaxID=879819 RepID=A0A0J0XGX0_9TREE|nr:HAD-like protein [Cutaneotrichosporon oleaginosum]KLT40340.1 HAD-like protein [Cutaneotrichosporon oleaginosum]TXT06495.1 hypothetical protein COLE_05826 [Cutaneotrichosporon oleaginosum]